MTNKERKGIKPALVVVSDFHCGCQLALCPPEGTRLDNGGTVLPNRFQKLLWKHFEIFWKEKVPAFTKGMDYDIVINGDSIDGAHHNSVTQVTQNLKDQKRLAVEVIRRMLEMADSRARLYVTRGTAAHVGPSAQYEEEVAKACGAVPDSEGRYARNRLRKYIAHPNIKNKRDWPLIDILHHIGTTGSQAYETTAILKELVEAFAEAGRWHERAPDCVVRSHRHRAAKVELPASGCPKLSLTTPAWQGKTDFAWKIPGARQSEPQFGGLVLISGDPAKNVETLYTRWYVESKRREAAE